VLVCLCVNVLKGFIPKHLNTLTPKHLNTNLSDMKFSFIFLTFFVVFIGALTPTTNAQVTYKLAFDSATNTYTVSAKSAVAYTGNLSRLTSSTQVSIVFPHVAGGYQIDSLTALQGSGSSALSWAFNRLDEPTENPNADYLFFSPTNTGTYTVFDFPANTYVDLFSFEGTSGCIDNILLFDNDTDPLSSNTSINAGNNFIVLAGGLQNQYTGNDNSAAPCSGITYCLEFDQSLEAFVVSIESDEAFTGPSARLAPSTQISIVAAAETGGYSVTSLTGLQAGSTPLTWSVSQINAPTENSGADYLFFTPSNTNTYTTFNIPANTKIPLFSFKSGNDCTDLILFDNQDDPLNTNPSYNADNNITILGGGQSNLFIGDDCGPACCCLPEAPMVTKD